MVSMSIALSSVETKKIYFPLLLSWRFTCAVQEIPMDCNLPAIVDEFLQNFAGENSA